MPGRLLSRLLRELAVIHQGDASVVNRLDCPLVKRGKLDWVAADAVTFVARTLAIYAAGRKPKRGLFPHDDVNTERHLFSLR